MSKNKTYILDMDGVLVTGNKAIPGAQQFIQRLIDSNAKFAILTNNPMYTPRDLAHRLKNNGLDVPADHLFTSAMATAQFLDRQMPNGSAFVIGETGLTLMHGAKLGPETRLIL
jgi:NagD protein